MYNIRILYPLALYYSPLLSYNLFGKENGKESDMMLLTFFTALALGGLVLFYFNKQQAKFKHLTLIDIPLFLLSGVITFFVPLPQSIVIVLIIALHMTFYWKYTIQPIQVH